MRRTPIARLAIETRTTFGVFHVADTCRRLGIAPSTVSRMVARGEAQRLHLGVAGLMTWPDSWERRAVALQLAGGTPNALTGKAAARILGLRYVPMAGTPRLRLVVPRGTRRTPRGVVETRRNLDASRIVRVGPFSVTDVAWTLAELASDLDAAQLRRAVEGAVADARTDAAALAQTAATFRHLRAVGRFRDAVAALQAQTHRTRSADERRVLRWVLAAGMPEPVVNLPVVDADGCRRVLDLAWPQYRVCVEVDLHPEHGFTIGRHGDGRRQNALAGDWVILRFDSADLTDPAYVLAVIARALRAAGAAW